MVQLKGILTGSVVDVNDPNGEGRIRVNLPWLSGENKLYWAPVATLMSGGGRGSWFMPEVGDEVLVAFEHEDADHPFVLGFLWNGQQKPPDTSSHKRLIKSVKGHTILLDDTDGSEKVQITTGGGHSVLLDDTGGSEKIEVTTSKGLKITLDDPSEGITIEASGQVTVQAPKVTVEAENIALGTGAHSSAVLGNELFAYLESLVEVLQAHMHPGELALGILPVTPAPSTPLPLVPPILSTVIMEA